MRCFNHPDVEAVAICKACNKALCMDCADETKTGIACADDCKNKQLESEKFYDEYHAQSSKDELTSHLAITCLFFIMAFLPFIYKDVYLITFTGCTFGLISSVKVYWLYIRNKPLDEESC